MLVLSNGQNAGGGDDGIGDGLNSRSGREEEDTEEEDGVVVVVVVVAVSFISTLEDGEGTQLIPSWNIEEEGDGVFMTTISTSTNNKQAGSFVVTAVPLISFVSQYSSTSCLQRESFVPYTAHIVSYSHGDPLPLTNGHDKT